MTLTSLKKAAEAKSEEERKEAELTRGINPGAIEAVAKAFKEALESEEEDWRTVKIIWEVHGLCLLDRKAVVTLLQRMGYEPKEVTYYSLNRNHCILHGIEKYSQKGKEVVGVSFSFEIQ